jgi:hypothetical protein
VALRPNLVEADAAPAEAGDRPIRRWGPEDEGSWEIRTKHEPEGQIRPGFIHQRNLMNLAGITDRVSNFADTLFSRIHGGMTQVNILGSLIFSGISGAALADPAGSGGVPPCLLSRP